jgi:F420H(2)-dependent quinone reductase
VANRIVRALHRIGLPVGTIHLLTVPGRRTGQPHTTPVSPLTVDGHRYVVAGLPQSGWVRNARAAGGGRRRAQPRVSSDRAKNARFAGRSPSLRMK